jgi:hypothetical protein
MSEAAGAVPLANLKYELITLRHSWQQWTRLVEVYAVKGRFRRPVGLSEYRRVHSQLLLCCRTVIEISEVGQKPFYESLEELAKPWMSPRILARTEPHFLADLADLCHQAERQLTGRARSSYQGLLFLLGVFGAIGVGFFALSCYPDGIILLDSLRSYPIMLYRAALATTFGQRLALGSIFLTITLMVLVSRVRRG